MLRVHFFEGGEPPFVSVAANVRHEWLSSLVPSAAVRPKLQGLLHS